MTLGHLICLGNELVCDDGVGFRVGRIIRRLPDPPEVRITFRQGVALELPELLQPGEPTLVVDAMLTGAPPGTVHLLDLDQVSDLAASHVAGHAAGLAEALAVTRCIAPERLPNKFSVLGVEVLVLDRYGVTLSAPVRRALPELVGRALRWFCAAPDRVALAEELARGSMHIDPDPADILDISS